MVTENRAHRKSQKRRGSALLVCTLAAVVVSMAAIAIVRSGRQSIARIEALRVNASSRHVAEGLTQRAIALLRADPNRSGDVIDANAPLPAARCRLVRLSPRATQIQVFLYAGATIPAVDVVVDPTRLSGALRAVTSPHPQMLGG